MSWFVSVHLPHISPPSHHPTHSISVFLYYSPNTVRFRHLPGHHAADAGPSTPAHQETHCWVCDSIPGPTHKQDDRGIEGIQLKVENGNVLRHETKTRDDAKYYLIWHC